MVAMDKFEAGTGIGQDSVLEVRVALVDSMPEIWRRFELRGSLTLGQIHQVLQTAFDWRRGCPAGPGPAPAGSGLRELLQLLS